jgi:hypothetical protein
MAPERDLTDHQAAMNVSRTLRQWESKNGPPGPPPGENGGRQPFNPDTMLGRDRKRVVEPEENQHATSAPENRTPDQCDENQALNLKDRNSLITMSSLLSYQERNRHFDLA